MAKIIFTYATKKKAQYLDKVVKLYRQGRSISSILREVPIGRTTVYLWVNEVFKGGTSRKSCETSCQTEMKKGKPTAIKSEEVAIEPIAAPVAIQPAPIGQCHAALKCASEPIVTEPIEFAEEINEGLEEEASLDDLDEKALRKMVRKLRKEVKTQTVRGDLYKKMLEIASEDAGIDFLKNLVPGSEMAQHGGCGQIPNRSDVLAGRRQKAGLLPSRQARSIQA